MVSFDSISNKDLKILRELDKDGRASYKQIGRATRLNDQVVRYHVTQLEKQDIITGYWGFVNLAGYSVHKILLKNRTMGADGRAALRDWLLDQTNVSWFARTDGTWDYVITVNAENESQFAALAQALLDEFGESLQAKSFLVSTEAYQANEKYLYDDRRCHTVYSHDYMEDRPETDATDEELLRLLALDGRATYTSLAEQLNMTPEGISKRVSSLRERGLVLGTKIRLDVNALGLSYYHLFISLRNRETYLKLRQYYLRDGPAEVIMGHLGRYDLHLEFIMHDQEIVDVMDELHERFGSAIGDHELLQIREEHTMHLLR